MFGFTQSWRSGLVSVAAAGLLLVSTTVQSQSDNWPGDRFPTANTSSVMAMSLAELQAAESYSNRPGVAGAGSVSYTHLTLPTNREV